jgi:subtilisin-like proprotein convertase family protein
MTMVRWRAVLVGIVTCALLAAGQASVAAAATPAIPSSESEPNGTTATASTIASGGRVRANLFPSGDVDFYKFTAAAGDRVYAAIMTSGSAGNSTDSQLTLLASDGTTVVEFDDDNGSFASLSSSIAGASIPSSGTYYLKVNDFTAVTASERYYDLYLQLRSGAPVPEVESNDTPATANPLPAGGVVSGARNPASPTEQDWYSMTLNAGDTVYLSLDLDPERDGTTWNGRLGFALFGDAANQILPIDDPGTGDVTPNPNIPSEAFYMTVKNAGTYYAFVDSASGAVGGPTATYNLNVTVVPAATRSCTQYTSTDVPKTIGPGTGLVSSTITVPGNPRIAHAAVSVNLNHAVMADIDAHLRSPAGNNNGLFSDIGSTTTGGQTVMDVVFDQEAAIPPSFTALSPLMLQPELNYRLSWLDGEQAGGTWTLDLYDDTAGANGGTLTGWSLNLCEPPAEGPTSTIFSTDFESGAAGFTHSGTADEWELGLPATVATTTPNPVADFSTCASGTNCWKTDLDNTYNVSSSQDLLSPSIDLTAKTGTIYASWEQRYQMESANFDHMSVSVEEVGNPSNSRPLYTWLDGTMTDVPGNPVLNIGASAGWGRQRADISDFAGKNIQLRFHLDSDTTVQFAGLGIDDVSVYQPTHVLTVATAGTGQGFVDSSPVGIDCGTFGTHTDCNEDYADGQLVTLTAHASAGSTFTSFTGGGCAGPSPCVVTMDQARSVTATFAQITWPLTVTTAGTGQGFVDSSPVGIDCGTFGTHTDCNQTYNDGQLVTLTAHASVGSTFTSFSGGGCAGPSPCVVTMDQARSVTATFTLIPVATYSATVLSDNPAGYWRFGEASGTVATDSSGNGNHGTYLNGPLLGQTGALVGDTNKAASFDGVNDTVRVPDSNSLDVGDSFSLEGWVKRTSGASSQTLFNKGANGIQLTVMNAANGNQLWLRKANVTTVARSNAPVPADGAYHYFVVTKNGPSTVIYIDNAASTTILAPVQVIANTASLLTFADPGSTVHVFDEWALYDSVLTAADVNEHYDAGT